MLIIPIIYSVFSIVYILLILQFILGWVKTKEYNQINYSGKTLASIILPVRNEEKHIADIVNDLLNQDYPNKLHEIIVIDDHSNDNTYNIVENLCKSSEKIEILSLSDTSGKKAAIKKGIKFSKGSIIITTDADCRIKNFWLSTIISFYEKYKPKIIVGPVIINNEQNIFEQMQSLEFLSLIGSGAGAIAINRAIMCNAANLAFEKEIYKGNEHEKYQSGDDILLLLKLKKKFKKSIMFLKSSNATVSTSPQKSLKALFQQRKRWTSKSRAYKDADIILTALIVFITNFLLFVSFILMWTNKDFLLSFIIIFFSKSIIDFIFLVKITKYFKKTYLLKIFIPLNFIYFFYISIIAIIGNIGKYKWKNRLVG
ncbi:MAG: glycosyltransferase [Bacteroidales bacterium]|nr:glycosyltransferase [Bacteroidales bacterium]